MTRNEDIQRRSLAGESSATIGAALGLNPASVRRIVRRLVAQGALPAREINDVDVSFWAKVAMAGPDDCWPWGASRKNNGYGAAWHGLGGRKVVQQAHRVAYYLATGEHPGQLDVMHSCDNRPCCNPAHLSLGTRLDNMRDAARKGRTGRGSRHGHARLNETQVAEIKRGLRDGLSSGLLARRFQVSQTNICHIRNGDTWGHVQCP